MQIGFSLGVSKHQKEKKDNLRNSRLLAFITCFPVQKHVFSTMCCVSRNEDTQVRNGERKKYCTIVEREERYMEEIDKEIAQLCLTMEKKNSRRHIIQVNKRMEKLEKEKRKRFKRVTQCKRKIHQNSHHEEEPGRVEDTRGVIGAENPRSAETAVSQGISVDILHGDSVSVSGTDVEDSISHTLVGTHEDAVGQVSAVRMTFSGL